MFKITQNLIDAVDLIIHPGDIVALKKLKMEREKEGFPITSLREINTLLKAQHPNIVTVRVGVLCLSIIIDLHIYLCTHISDKSQNTHYNTHYNVHVLKN